MHKFFSRLFILTFFVVTAVFADFTYSYPGRYTALSVKKPTTSLSECEQKGKKLALEALQVPSFTHPVSPWQPTIKNIDLQHALKEFEEGKRGQSIKNIKLKGLTPPEIHYLLISLGFKHVRQHLGATKGLFNRDGSISPSPTSPVSLDFYYHSDGGVVRVKPEGTPDPEGVNPAPEPQVSKYVLLKLPKDHDSPPDTSYENEGFKVTEKGYPIPKAPHEEFGFRKLYPQNSITPCERKEEMGWEDTLMHHVHLPISTIFPWSYEFCLNTCYGTPTFHQSTLKMLLDNCPLDVLENCPLLRQQKG